MPPPVNDTWIDILACPDDHSKLHLESDSLVCANCHRFSVEQGVPVFAASPRREPFPSNMAPCPQTNHKANHKEDSGDNRVDPFVNDWIVNTNGNLYWRARGKLPRYPIPNWPFGSGGGKVLVDIGCGWGRWCISAARAGFKPIGLDVHIDALAAAGRVSRQLAVPADFICSDAEHLPFQPRTVDWVFSYSVLQHLDKAKVLCIFAEIARVLKPGGVCLIQLPNVLGPLSILRQLKRGFREAQAGTFEMRYWSRRSILEALREAGLRDVVIRADGFFSQNPQLADLDLLSPAGKLVVLTSYAGRKTAGALPILTRIADSLWIEARAKSL